MPRSFGQDGKVQVSILEEWWLPDFWRPGTHQQKATPSPTSPFTPAPATGPLPDARIISTGTRPKGNVRQPGIPALTAPLGTTWRLGRLTTASLSMRPACILDFATLHHAAYDNHCPTKFVVKNRATLAASACLRIHLLNAAVPCTATSGLDASCL
jgi:hypothetical protein